MLTAHIRKGGWRPLPRLIYEFFRKKSRNNQRISESCGCGNPVNGPVKCFAYHFLFRTQGLN